MQNHSVPPNAILLGSPTPPSSGDDLDQELARLDDTEAKRPHFLDYDPVPPTDLSSIQPLIQPNAPMDGLTNGTAKSSEVLRAGTSGKKHFLDENPIPPDYDFQRRSHRSLDREHDRNGRNEIYKLTDERGHSIERAKQQKKPKEMTYAILRFMETPDDRVNSSDGHCEFLEKCNEYVGGAVASGSTGRFDTKVECVYSLLSIMGSNNAVNVSAKFLELSKMPGSTMRGSIPWLVTAIHTEADELTRKQARQALHNVVHQSDDKAGRREAKVLRHIEQILDYCDAQKQNNNVDSPIIIDSEAHPLQAMCSLMKLSFDQDHRHAMCLLGALQTIAVLVQCDHAMHGTDSTDPKCILLRRYAGMTFTNLTFGDGNNKANLCANREFMKALVAQVATEADDLLQVTANVLRNLSWRADPNMKTVLYEIGTVTALAKAAIKNKHKSENTLRAVMSALWNLTTHKESKDEFLSVDGALAFLVDMLTYEAPSKTMTIVESAGGILSNVSSHIAKKPEYRRILRSRNCLGILLQHLKSESLTVVSNACNMLWNLSARCEQDQKYLHDNGAVPMLRSLINSKHPMISNGSKAALKNLVINRPGEVSRSNMDPVARMIGLKELPTLNVRKQRALEQELDRSNLPEMNENADEKTPPGDDGKSITDVVAVFAPTSSSSDSTVVDRKVQKPPKSGSAATDESSQERKTNTGTIPKRRAKHHSNDDRELDIDQLSNTSNASSTANSSSVGVEKLKPDPEPDLDQIRNFALLDDENHDGHKIVAGEDSTKCYENEGTPHTFLSNAASVSDLHAPIKHHHVTGTNKHLKSGRNTTDNSGIHTPEKPIYYCEEGTPMYFSNHDSFSSLDEEHIRNDREQLKKQPKAQQSNSEYADVGDFGSTGNDSEAQPGVETGETASKSVKFNECLETPMMFSRQSSMQSLTSLEPAQIDDVSSVVSEISRMPSGIISPSEIPDSPSQTMPQSPRRRRIAADTPSPPPHADNAHATGSITTNGSRHLASEDEQVRTYGVENTPFHISCATSLSNLSLDEETKITTDCLLKEMRLMHQLSDEQDDVAAAASATTLQTKTEEENAQNASLDDEPSDSDDSVNDSILLAACINKGMKRCIAGSASDKIAAPPMSLPLPLKSRNDHHSSSEGDDDDADNEVLKKCIRIGKQTMTRSNEEDAIGGSSSATNGVVGPPRSLPPHHFKENPIGMLRKGGNAYLDSASDKMKPFNVEDTPCNFSVVSALSELTIASNATAPTLPNTNTQENVDAERSAMPDPIYIDSNHSLSSIGSNDSNVDLEEILKHTIKKGMRKEPAAASTHQQPQQQAPHQPQQRRSQLQPFNPVAGPSQVRDADAVSNHSFSSIDSIDNVDLEEILQNTIKKGMRKEAAASVRPNEDRPVGHASLASANGRIVPNAAPNHINRPTVRSQQTSNSNSVPEPIYIASNHSLSSIDSNISNVNLDEILQHAINVGKGIEPASSIPPKSPAHQQQQRRSQLPMFKATAGPTQGRDHRSSRDRKDEQILLNCIQTGMERLRFNGSENTPPTLPHRTVHQHRGEPQINDHSKNAHTTSAAVLVTAGATSMVPGVVRSHQEGTIIERDLHRPEALAKERNSAVVIVDHTDELPAPPETGYNGCCSTASALNASFVSTKSQNSFNSGHGTALLEQSNEYPAIFGPADGISDSDNSPSMAMDVSNEFLFEKLSPKKVDKHKDPDLMLQSVERLTHDFVSTAEYLRTAKASDDGGDGDEDDDDEDTSTLAEDKKSFSTSQNTWNETIDVSFPSISRSVPVIASMEDDDTSNSDPNHGIKFTTAAKSEPIDEPTPTNECKTIVGDADVHFDIGGQISQMNFMDIGPNYRYSSNVNSFDTNSTMTNSTIITMEANKIRSELLHNGDRTDSTISLDKIRPPSAMDKLSFCEPLSNSPSSLKTSGKYLTQGFMARRALNNGAHGSMDSINSSCNLDRVKPPSLMDELLDSMISVDSIASEFVDAPLQPDDPSNYETALSECDDMTMTLKNCAELPMDSTPCGSDFSSVESTPKKSRRSLTPRRKRQLARDRYQTYTISPETKGEQAQTDQADDGQFMEIHDDDNTLLLNDDNDALSLVSDDGEMSSIRALTKKLTYLQDINTNTYTKKSSERFADLNGTSSFRPELARPKKSESLTNGQSGSQPAASSNTVKSPRIVIPTGPDRDNTTNANNDQKEVVESKAIRGRKKAAYVSPYAMAKLTKPAAKPVSPPVIKSVTTSPVNKSLSPRTTPSTVKSAAVKSPEPTKSTSPSIARAKSLIQRSAESLRKIRPAIASKLTKQNSLSPTTTTAPENSPDEAAHSPGTSTLIRQNTFTKDEPSATHIPVISSEPSSPKKTSIPKIATKIPFNRSVSASVQRNVTKCQTNIEIPLQKSAANVKRNMNMKSATSASHIMSPASSLSSTPKQSPKVEQRTIVGDIAAGRNIFKRFSPLQKSNPSIQSKLPSVNAKPKLELKSATPSTSIPAKSKIATGRIPYVAK